MIVPKKTIGPVIQTRPTVVTDLTLPLTPDHNQPANRGNLLTEIQTAERLGVHFNTVKKLVRDGVLKRVKMPGVRSVRYRAETVDALIREWEGA